MMGTQRATAQKAKSSQVDKLSLTDVNFGGFAVSLTSIAFQGHAKLGGSEAISVHPSSTSAFDPKQLLAPNRPKTHLAVRRQPPGRPTRSFSSTVNHFLCYSLRICSRGAAQPGGGELVSE